MSDYSYTLNEPILEVRNVSVNYAAPVLRDVSFTIRNIVRPGMTQGQVVALLAPSGMGKTQLFRCIAGLKRPNAGEVFLNEQNCIVQPGMVGVVAQDYPLFDHLTIYDNVVLAARKKYPKDEARKIAVELLHRFGMDEDRVLLYPHEVSGGQRQRVAIIQQFVRSGHLLLMDEPFSGLDVNLKDEVQALIGQLALADELNTIILTTHDIASAIAVSDTILLLGRERDATGNTIPGARIIETINVIERGLAWHPDIADLPEFHRLETEIRAKFRSL